MLIVKIRVKLLQVNLFVEKHRVNLMHVNLIFEKFPLI